MKNALEDEDDEDEEARTTFKGAFIKGAILLILIYIDCSNYYSKDWDSHRRVPFEIGKWRRRAMQEKNSWKKRREQKGGNKKVEQKKTSQTPNQTNNSEFFCFSGEAVRSSFRCGKNGSPLF